MLSFDLLIPSHGWALPIENLLKSVTVQTVLPVRIIILVWKSRTPFELQELSQRCHDLLDSSGIELSMLYASTSDHQQGRGVGYDRWFLIQQAVAPYVCMIDEDNTLPPGLFKKWISGYQEVIASLGHEAIVSPTIMQGNTIQSQGITGFSYLFPRYVYDRCGDQPWHQVKMIWANSLFGRTALFQEIQFDPVFAWSYEDIDFSSRVVQAGYGVVVLRDVWIDHYETPKTFLGKLFLWTPRDAFLRSRNRIVRVRKTASWRQKICYFGCGLWIQTFGRIRYIVRAEGARKKELIFAIFQWIKFWL